MGTPDNVVKMNEIQISLKVCGLKRRESGDIAKDTRLNT